LSGVKSSNNSTFSKMEDRTSGGKAAIPWVWTTRPATPMALRQRSKVSDEEIQDIVLTANLTPRKCLGFKTPFQAILKELGKDIQIRFS